jgi:predicted RNA methylase
MKRKQLVWQLEALETFSDPKLHLEQYATSVEMAAEILEAVDRECGLNEKTVGDFGCGPGILMIGAALMGAKCRGFELDEATAEICRQNIDEAEVKDTCTVEVKDVSLFPSIIHSSLLFRYFAISNCLPRNTSI